MNGLFLYCHFRVDGEVVENDLKTWTEKGCFHVDVLS